MEWKELRNQHHLVDSIGTSGPCQEKPIHKNAGDFCRRSSTLEWNASSLITKFGGNISWINRRGDVELVGSFD